MRLFVAMLLVVIASGGELTAQSVPPSEPPPDWEATAIDYSNVPYPYPVSYLDVRLYGQDHRMAYMDVAPASAPNGRTVLIFHGMNFFAAPYAPMIDALAEAGFRVIAIDRLGYGRSSKPDIHYNLHVPATNTKALLDELGIEQAAVVGHSMGGATIGKLVGLEPNIDTIVGVMPYQGDRDFYDNTAAFDGAALYITADHDTTAPPSMAIDWFNSLENADRALRLSPRDPLMLVFHVVRSWALFLLERFAEAADAARQSISLGATPIWAFAWLAAAEQRADHPDAARDAVAQLLTRVPHFSISYLWQSQPHVHPDSVDSVIKALRELGIPE